MNPEAHRRDQLAVALATQRQGAAMKTVTVKFEFEIYADTAAEGLDRAAEAAEAIVDLGFVSGTVDASNVTGPREMPEDKG